MAEGWVSSVRLTGQHVRLLLQRQTRLTFQSTLFFLLFLFFFCEWDCKEEREADGCFAALLLRGFGLMSQVYFTFSSFSS